jgi:hypothetical protein
VHFLLLDQLLLPTSLRPTRSMQTFEPTNRSLRLNIRFDEPLVSCRLDGLLCAVYLNFDPQNDPSTDRGRRTSPDQVVLQQDYDNYVQSSLSGCAFCTLIRDAIDNMNIESSRKSLFTVELKAQEPQRIRFYGRVLRAFSLHPGSTKTIEPFRHCKQVSASAGSGEGMAYLRHCYQACLASHVECGLDRSTTPSRLLSLGKDNSHIRIIETTTGESFEYAALSHCWGGSEYPCILELGNECSMKRSVPWGSLPQTYRDAITVCRELELQYLWIDSLCIRQDDREDWAREAEKMSDIYETAHLVIAANCSSTPDYSFLSHQRPASFDEKVLAWTDDDRCQPLLYLHKARRRGIHNHGNGKYDRDPLDNRGWTFQEQRLARRLVSFTSEETQWSCRAIEDCECSGEHRASRAAVAEESNALKEWAKIVEAYSARILTFETDRLPALSGLAARFESKHRLEYIAGLWNHNIVQQLAWIQSGGRYRDGWIWETSAPTFSWASINGEIGWPTEVAGLEDVKHYAKTVDAHITLKGQNRFGEISDGYVLLRGRLICADFVYSAFGDWDWVQLLDSNGIDLGLTIHSDGDVRQKHLIRTIGRYPKGGTFWWNGSQSDEPSIPVTCLKLVGWHSTDYYLLLVQSKFVEGAYERVGLVSTDKGFGRSTNEAEDKHLLSLWSEAPEQDITIV